MGAKLGKIVGKSMYRRNGGANTNFVYMLTDILLGIFSYYIAAIINHYYLDEASLFSDLWAVCLGIVIIYIMTNKDTRAYNVTTFFYRDRFVLFVTRSYLLSLAVNVLLPYLTHDRRIYENAFQLFFFVIIYFILLLINAMFNRYLVTKTHLLSQRSIMIGNKRDYKDFIHCMHRSNFNAEIVGFLSFDREQGKDANYLGNIDDLVEIIQNNNIDQIFIMSKHEKDIATIQNIMDICNVMGVTTRLILNVYKSNSVQRYVSSIGKYPVMTYHAVPLSMSTKFFKRLFDIIVSSILIVVTSPIVLVTAIAIKLDSKGPVFFKQRRVGKNGRIFDMYKLRSMCNDAEAKKKDLLKNNQMNNNLMFKMSDDPRITKVGRFIRKTSIDELPQLFNVLKGDMSLVGTRPPTVDEVSNYTQRHWKRLVIWPGITGNWQVNGRSKITDFEEVVDLDVEYIDNWTPSLDLKILLKTFVSVIGRNDAY
ncbi:sugar transferase [Lachnospira pectinoschiza]|uniref:Exopolysaccharide biosynthesis polyprenyl glycosylphosphotransferase n=1 Tax=Lachnospira pectinoschiza TaxID=28052 RepID=A0A1G9WIK6_9FIRM|nr:sugar transferase [Lachnospira pectinoschiza]SDM84093.1 exopolysaccharide biosynthesis polyprenyl glycosylphosphotransferase [Lachnospira pectinoschiza]